MSLRQLVDCFCRRSCPLRVLTDGSLIHDPCLRPRPSSVRLSPCPSGPRPCRGVLKGVGGWGRERRGAPSGAKEARGGGVHLGAAEVITAYLGALQAGHAVALLPEDDLMAREGLEARFRPDVTFRRFGGWLAPSALRTPDWAGGAPGSGSAPPNFGEHRSGQGHPAIGTGTVGDGRRHRSVSGADR
jgi:hypothetical protein